MAERLKTPVHALDLRNHGESFWSADEMTYDVMARDVHRWIRDHVPNQRVTLLGHSMALYYCKVINHLGREGGNDDGAVR